MKDLQYTSNL